MSNEAVFRAVAGTYIEETDNTIRAACCGEVAGSGRCTCHEPAISAAERRRRAAMKVRPAEDLDSFEPPDAYGPAIAAARAKLGLPAVPVPQPAAPVRAIRAAAPRFPLKPRPSRDPYEAHLKALRRRHKIGPTPTLPANYDGGPPDPYAAPLRALQEVV
ncbi:MAG TPA: hypothetical protein VMR44_05830 [Thermoanaerobaculia bacterium]|nr:hypothetical protein [Thermoanaerobaculia bacterium]